MIGASKADEEGAASAVTDAEGATPADGALDREPHRHRLRSERWPLRPPAAVLIIGLLVTAALAWVSSALYTNNEKRLLDLRLRDVASVLSAALPNIQTPLASAAALADATNGNVQKFTHFIAQYVGTGPGRQFVSASLWRLDAIGRGPIAVVGTSPELGVSMQSAQAFFAAAAHTQKLSLIGVRAPSLSRLGYAFTTPAPTSRFAAYAETALPSDRRSRLQSNTAFSDLDYAIYLGPSERSSDVLVTSLSHLPVRGRQARTTIPFGDTVLTLVVAPRQPLAGALPQRLPWIIAVVGFLLTLGAAALTVSLIGRRRDAERLADSLAVAVGENQRLYAQQRTIAQTLQHALLPDRLPQLQGAEASGLYEPGEQGVEIGGDWYDVIPLDEQRLLMVVGDVSGRGLRAATTMASLRYAIHAYAAQDDLPATILSKLSGILSVMSSGQIATVLCVVVDPGSRRLTLTSAGHLPPLLISGDRGEYLDSEVGLPVGIEKGARYVSRTVQVPTTGTLLAFTDGLVERRGETLDRGLARLRAVAVAVAQRGGLPDLLGDVLEELRHAPSEDDSAIVGVRWSV